uniref:Uncharacterized protein n=1 Tax=Myotis myotis TaxID=51298 RepID=A0A7J7SCD3_MYOMY|nr:hypothetical protein mMyoMyo1_009456 [Myotis myotis]
MSFIFTLIFIISFLMLTLGFSCCSLSNSLISPSIFLKYILLIFLKRGRERDRELETSMMREKHRSAASCTLPTGNVPTTQVHALDRNRTRDPSVRRLTLYPLRHTSQGFPSILNDSLAGYSILGFSPLLCITLCISFHSLLA